MRGFIEPAEKGSSRLTLLNSKIRHLHFVDLERELSAPKDVDKNREVKFFRRLGRVTVAAETVPNIMELTNLTNKLGIHPHSTLRFWDDSSSLQEVEEFEFSK